MLNLENLPDQTPSGVAAGNIGVSLDALPDTHADTLRGLYRQYKVKPDEFAKQRQLSKSTGLPMLTVQANQAQVADLALEPDWAGLQQRSPKTAEALVKNTDLFNLAKDDTENLGLWDRFLNSTWRAAKRGFVSGVQGSDASRVSEAVEILDTIDKIERGELKTDADLARGSRFGSMFAGVGRSPENLAAMKQRFQQQLSDNALEYLQRAEKLRTKELQPTKGLQDLSTAETFGDGLAAVAKNPSTVVELISQSMGTMAPYMPLIAAGGVAGGVRGLMATTGASSATVEYVTSFSEVFHEMGIDLADTEAARKAMATPEFRERMQAKGAKAAVIGMFDGLTAGVAGVMLAPAKVAGRALSKGQRAGTNIAAQTGVQGAGGGAGEALGATAAGEDISPGAVLSEIIAEMPGGAVDVLLLGAKRATQDGVKMQDALRDAQQLEQMLQLAAQSKLLQRSPETFAQFVQEVADSSEGALKEVFIDAQTLNEVLAQAGVEQGALLGAMPSVAEQMQEATEGGGSIAIPVGEFTASVVGTGLEQALLPHLRTAEDAMSLFEAQQASQQAQQYLQEAATRVMQQAADAEAVKASAEVVKTQLLDQLNTAKRFTADVNEAYASLVRDFYTVTASRMGLSPEELHRRYPLRVGAAGDPNVEQFTQLDEKSTAVLAGLEQDVEVAKLGDKAKTMRRMYKAAGKAKPQFDALMTQIARAVDGEAMLAALKGTARAVAKIQADYNGDPTKIKDLVRGTVEIRTAAQAQQAVLQILANFKVLPTGQRNLLDPKADPVDGYRDAKFNVDLGNGLVGEVQVNLPAMLAAKKRVHGLYEERSAIERETAGRERTPGEQARIDGLNARMKVVYDAAWAESMSDLNSGSESGAPLRRADSGSNTLGGDTSQAAQENGQPGTLPSETGTPSTSKNSGISGTSDTIIANAEVFDQAARVVTGQPLFADIIASLGLTPEEVNSTAIEFMTGLPGDMAFLPPAAGGLKDVVALLHERRLESGLPRLDINEPGGRAQLARLVAAEALAAIRNAGDSLEWYDTTVAKTLAMMAVKHPELNDDPNARNAFLVATAIASQGLNVEDNLAFASQQYAAFRATGQFPLEGKGESSGAMVANFQKANEMIAELGADKFRQFLVTPFTVRELEYAGFPVGGETMDTVVLGSSIFGPKIGFGFYSNLNGNFEPVTMDMWFMRTIGRLAGTLPAFEPAKFAKQVKRLRDSLDVQGDNGVFANQFDPALVEAARTDEGMAIELARQAKKAHERDFKNNRADYDAKTRVKSDLVAASETMLISLEKPKDVPASGGERNLLRDVVRQVVNIVAEQYGQRVPPAALQALIWYPEQELYKAMGVKLRVTSQDYAGAARKLLESEGFDGQQLDGAAEQGAAGARRTDGAADTGATQGNDQGPRRALPLEASERTRFVVERNRLALAKQRGLSPANVVFEVAPDPNDAELTNAWRDLTSADRLEISQRVANQMLPAILQTLAADGQMTAQVGSYLEDTNPSFALRLNQGNPVELAQALGFILAQDSMVVVGKEPFAGSNQTGAVAIEVGDKTPAQIDEIYQILRKITINGEQPVGGQSTVDGEMVVLNFSNTPTQQLAAAIDEALAGSYTVKTRNVHSAFPEKKDYDYAASERDDRRGSDAPLRRWARDARAEAQQRLRAELERAGNGGEFYQSAIGAGAQRANAPDGAGGQGPNPHAWNGTGVHFSKQRRTTLDGRFFGTGLKGVEQTRLAESTDPRIRERVYFYVDEGAGLRPEAGVGGFAHEVELSNLYNVEGDPLKLFNSDANASESRVLDAGYDGYYFPNYVNGQGIAVVMGAASRGLTAKAVPTPGSTFSAAPAAPAVYRRGLLSRELDSLDLEAVRAVAPSANVRAGNFTVKAEELEAARGVLAGQGINLPDQVLNQSARGLTSWFGTPGPDNNLVNEDGTPMLLYHGTTKAAAAALKAGQPFVRSQTGAMGSAVYLGDSPEASAGYDQGALLQVYARGKYLTNMQWTEYVNRHGWKGAEAAARADGYAGVYDRMFESAIAVWDPANIVLADQVLNQSMQEDMDAQTQFLTERAQAAGYPDVDTWLANDVMGFIKAAEEWRTLNPAEALTQPARGTFNPRTLEITLLKDADLSTFLHETGHFFLEVMADLASQPGAPADIATDMAAVLKWFGVKDLATWNTMGLEQKRPYHEKFAESFEQHLFEGNAPTAELKPLFRRFREWMVSVYKSLDAFLKRNDNQLNDEVRAVFNRMLAAEAQIKEAERTAGMLPDFNATNEAIEKLQSRSLRDLKWVVNARSRLLKQLQRDVEAKRKATKAEVTAEVRAMPEYAVQRFLKFGELIDEDGNVTKAEGGKLSLPVLKELYGEGPAAPWRYLATNMVTKDADTGLHPNMVAELFGFPNGDEMVRAVLNAQPEDAMIDGMTDQRLLERYGDLVTEQGIERAANEAIHNEARARFVASELKAMREGMNQRERTPGGGTVNVIMQAAKEFAQNLVARRKVRDLKPGLHTAAESRAAKRATEAQMAGDTEAALQAKRDQLLSHYAAKYTLDAQDEIDKKLDFLRKFEKESVRAKLPPEYLEQIDTLLDRFDLRRGTSLKAIDRRATLLAWVQAQQDMGLDPAVPDELLDEAMRKSYKEMTVEEFRGLVDTVRNIEHLGRLKDKLLTLKDKREFAAVVAQVEGSIRDNATKERPARIDAPSTVDRAVDLARGFFSSHRKLASLVRQMDGNKDGGAFWNVFIRTMNSAADTESVMREKATKQLAKIFDPLLKSSKLRHKVFIPAINRSLSLEARLAIALNWGNDANRQRVMDGDRWSQRQVEAILSTLTSEQLQFVQRTWDYIDSFWPDIKAKEERVSGVAPEKVQASPVTVVLADGTSVNLRGGYYPIKYDTDRSSKADADNAAEITKQMLQGQYTRATTRRGHTKQRAEEVNRAVRKDIGVVFQHVEQVAHDLAWHEWLIDANRLLRSGPISGAIRETMGPEVLREFNKALLDIAAGDVPAQSEFETVVNHLRQGTTVVGMGWNLMTSLMQPLGLTQSMVRIGPKWVGKGLARWIGDAARMENTAKEVYAKSEFMRLRGETMNREIREIRNKVQGELAGPVKETYFYLIQKGQLIADLPTWLGQYEKAMASGPSISEEEAIAQADQAVRDSQGGGAIADLARMQRGSPLMKLFTNFYSYFNVTFNLTAERFNGTKFKDPLQAGRFMVDMLLLYTVPAVLGFALKEALRGSDDDDDLWDSLAREQLNYLLGTIVGLRELGAAVQGFTGYQGPAGTRFFSEIAKLAKQAEQGEVDAALLKALNNTTGILLHYPAGQVNRMVEGYLAYTEGRTDNPMALVVGPPTP